MIAPPKRDNMFDFPGILFVVALNQHLSSVLGGSGPIHYLRAYAKAYAKAYASLRGLRGAPASQLLGAHLRGQTLSSSVEVHCGSSSWKIETFSASAVLAAPALRSKVQHKRESNICPRIWLQEKVYAPKMP